ncbi:hypothetical protein AB0L30_36735 [Microbispora rosea]|uniref:hypothetical protein n=1 Tax=Microbispora rosea TaxID=58117 RepID=UPI00341CCDCF
MEATLIRVLRDNEPGATPASVRDLITTTGVGTKEHVADLGDRQRRSLLSALTRRPELVANGENGD